MSLVKIARNTGYPSPKLTLLWGRRLKHFFFMNKLLKDIWISLSMKAKREWWKTKFNTPCHYSNITVNPRQLECLILIIIFLVHYLFQIIWAYIVAAARRAKNTSTINKAFTTFLTITELSCDIRQLYIWRWLSCFPAKMTLVCMHALHSIEKISYS